MPFCTSVNLINIKTQFAEIMNLWNWSFFYTFAQVFAVKIITGEKCEEFTALAHEESMWSITLIYC